MGKRILMSCLVFLCAAGTAYPSAAPLPPPSDQQAPDQDDSGLPSGQPLSEAPTSDSEEEMEDKDETSKEKAPQQTTLTLNTILEQLYARQLLVFDEHQHDVATPPPKF
jgi:hypothetical protein